jgi:hypothetical protein
MGSGNGGTVESRFFGPQPIRSSVKSFCSFMSASSSCTFIVEAAHEHTLEAISTTHTHGTLT